MQDSYFQWSIYSIFSIVSVSIVSFLLLKYYSNQVTCKWEVMQLVNWLVLFITDFNTSITFDELMHL